MTAGVVWGIGMFIVAMSALLLSFFSEIKLREIEKEEKDNYLKDLIHEPVYSSTEFYYENQRCSKYTKLPNGAYGHIARRKNVRRLYTKK